MQAFDKIKKALNPDHLTDEEREEAEAKKARIKFHRENVRNGPRQFATVTEGDRRRAQGRFVKSAQKKTRRKQVRAFKQRQQRAATVRGHLKIVGVLDFADPAFRDSLTHSRIEASLGWLVAQFAPGEGEVEVTPAVVAESLERALNFYQQSVGQPVTKLPSAFSVPQGVDA